MEDNIPPVSTKAQTTSFFENAGETGRIISGFNWKETSLSDITTWPQSLLTTLSIVLSSRSPMFLFWGPEYLFFYNDAYRPTLGNDGKHPHVLGKPAAVVWPESWPVIKPFIDQVYQKGEAALMEDQLIPIIRNGKPEDVYWSFSYSVIKGESGEIIGVFGSCTETTSKVRTYSELIDKQDFLAFAVEATELGTWDLDPVTGRLRSNARLMDWYGLTTNEEIDLSEAMQVVAESDRQAVKEAIEQALKPGSGGIFDIEYTIVNKRTSQERIVRAKGKAWFNEEGNAYRFNGTLQDMTSEVLARRQLQASEAKLRSVIAAAPAGIGLFVGQDLVIQLHNQTFTDIVGKGPDIEGKPLAEVMPELQTENQPFLKILDEVYTTGKMFQSFGSQVKILKDGRMTDNYYNITYTPLFNEEGNVYAILDIAVDVTGEIKARQKLEESERRFWNMAESTNILIAVYDETGNATYFNNAWLLLTGKPAEEFMDFGWTKMIHEEDRKGFVDLYLKALQNKEPWKGEFRFLKSTGEYSWLHATGTPRVRLDGSFDGYISSSIDITELKESKVDLEHKNNQLLKINSDLDNFIYTASHDLRAPVSNIEGLLVILRSNLESYSISAETANILDLIERSISRFKATISDLTEISKVQKLQEEDTHEINLSELTEDVLLSINDKIQEAGAVIKTDFSECCNIRFSKKNLQSILYNLISNAVKYRDHSRVPEVWLKTVRTEEYLILTISDNGLGIESSNMGKVFSMFKRFHNHVEGSGIGLYIVKRIIENAGGRIEVESEEFRGTKFSVFFPSSYIL